MVVKIYETVYWKCETHKWHLVMSAISTLLNAFESLWKDNGYTDAWFSWGK